MSESDKAGPGMSAFGWASLWDTGEHGKSGRGWTAISEESRKKWEVFADLANGMLADGERRIAHLQGLLHQPDTTSTESQDFGWAVRQMKQGGNVRRQWWANDVYLHVANAEDCFRIHFNDPLFVGTWWPSMDDLWAEDWEGYVHD